MRMLALLMFLVLRVAGATPEDEQVPAIEFKDMVWFGDPTGTNHWGWVEGRDKNDLFPRNMGALERKTFTGRQKLSWNGQEYDLTVARKHGESWWLAFPGGLIVVRKLSPEKADWADDPHWEGEFTATGAAVARRFRTHGDVP